MGNNAKSSSQTPLRQRYDALVEGGQIMNDEAQREVLKALESLYEAFSKSEGGVLSKLFTKSKDNPPGVYIWGNVGRGKSMLMDMFFSHAPVEKKRRVHFHAFMQEVHAAIHEIRKEGMRGDSGADPVVVLANRITKETSLLCFDELQATDVADATLLYRLFNGLFEGGVIIVSTSNHPPVSLYTGGVQRERFNRFIQLIESNMQVISLSSPHDYRHMQIGAMQQTYVWPLGTGADHFVKGAIDRLCSNQRPHTEVITVQGRKISFRLYDNAVGRFTFHELCETALGAADYLALAQHLDTMIITDIPALPSEKRNEAKRFVTLIDALYEHKVKLLCTAAVPPEEIYSEGDGSFEFNRTVSRLKEMQSAKWFKDGND